MNENSVRIEQGNLDNQGISEAAKLAVIAGVITTFGDALATMAAFIALEEARQEKNDSGSGDNNSMQKQIDYLTSEMAQLKRQMKKLTPPKRS